LNTWAQRNGCQVKAFYLANLTVWVTFYSCVVVTQVPLHEIRLSQRELHQMNVPDVKAESQNASIRNDEASASLVKLVKAQIASNWLQSLPRSEVRTASGAKPGMFCFTCKESIFSTCIVQSVQLFENSH